MQFSHHFFSQKRVGAGMFWRYTYIYETYVQLILLTDSIAFYQITIMALHLRVDKVDFSKEEQSLQKI